MRPYGEVLCEFLVLGQKPHSGTPDPVTEVLIVVVRQGDTRQQHYRIPLELSIADGASYPPENGAISAHTMKKLASMLLAQARYSEAARKARELAAPIMERHRAALREDNPNLERMEELAAMARAQRAVQVYRRLLKKASNELRNCCDS